MSAPEPVAVELKWSRGIRECIDFQVARDKLDDCHDVSIQVGSLRHLVGVVAAQADVIDYLRGLALTATSDDPDEIAAGAHVAAVWELAREAVRLTGGRGDG